MKTLPLKISNNYKHIQSKQEIANSAKSPSDQKAEKAAKEFETLLASMMVKSMTKASGGFFGKEGSSFGGDMFDNIFENNLASYLTEKHSLGISDAILKKLPHTENPNSADAIAKPAKAIGANEEIESFESSEHAKMADPIVPSRGSLNRLEKYDAFINEASKKYKIDKNLIKSVILTESAGNSKAISNANAKGLMQLMDKTARDMGVNNVFHPRENIFGGTKYLSQMMKKFNSNIDLSLAAYNAGPGNVEKYNGVPPFDETQNYITRVMGYYKFLNG